MRIQHNISALNTHRNLAFNNTQTSKALEKLSSGYKINRAGDDAAGLAISEKMRGQIRGLDMASKNSQDGISLIQTTEGALNETHSILQRMRELAVQAGNDTNTTQDREEIQKEINQLTSEINRIGNTTEFNTKKLLNGDLSAQAGGPVDKTFAKNGTVTVGTNQTTWSSGKVGAASGTNISFSGTADNGFDWSNVDTSGSIEIERTADGFTLKATGFTDTSGRTLDIAATKLSYDAKADEYKFESQGISLTLTKEQVKDWGVGNKATVNVEAGDATAASIDIGSKTQSVTTTSTASGNAPAITAFKVSGSNLEGLNEVKVDFASGKLKVELKGENGIKNVYELSVSGNNPVNFSADGVSFTFTGVDPASGATTLSGTFKLETESREIDLPVKDNSLKFQIGANENQAMSVSIEDMRANALGITGKAGDAGFTKGNEVTNGTNATGVEAALDLSTHESAASAVTVLDAAIAKVSSERAKLGAVQNRLEHTINNLGASSENLTAAESRIRDTDMAAAMMDFTKNNILTQAAQSMLAQANQQPQGVLQLLG